MDQGIALEMLQRLPDREAEELLALADQYSPTDPEFSRLAESLLGKVDWSPHRASLAELIGRILPIDRLVPDAYAEWRDLARSALGFFVAHLNSRRLAVILVAQLTASADTPLERRIAPLLARAPTLQKIGQILARNRHLTLALKHQLIRLENQIREVDAERILSRLREDLGAQIPRWEIELDAGVLAEASVAVVIAFHWRNPSTEIRERGVFKLLKPHAREHIAEELAIIHAFLQTLEQEQPGDGEQKIRIRKLLGEVGALVRQECDLAREQEHLRVAAQTYATHPEIQVPQRIPELCAPTRTAMSYLSGRKITDCLRFAPGQCQRLATLLVESVLLRPLFDPEEHAVFHGDPHPGNVWFDPDTGELQLLDWALMERLSLSLRRRFILLLAGVILRDQALVIDAFRAMMPEEMEPSESMREVVRDSVCEPPITQILGLSATLELIRRLVLAGFPVETSLLLLRKNLFILEGVLHDIAPETKLETIVLRYLARHLPELWRDGEKPDFIMPLQAHDYPVLLAKLHTYGLRVLSEHAIHQLTKFR